MRLFAIGDIHGCRQALQRLDQEIQFCATDTVVTLGDYVDRGPDSRGVIEHLFGLRKRCRLIALKGNHEVMMLRARADCPVVADWLSFGGDAALDSYPAKTLDDIPDAHWRFLESTVDYHETSREFFVHANANPDVPLQDQPDYMLQWEFLGHPAPHQSGKRMICGHTSQHTGRPLNLGHAVCIDTNCCNGGCLTCLDVRTNAYWLDSEAGDVRQGVLG